jgi:hypothetical protein
VELLVELRGKKSQCGVDAILKPGNSELGFINLLRPFEPSDAIGADPDQEALDKRLEEIRRRIVESQLVAHASEVDKGYSVSLRAEMSKRKAIPSDVGVRVWPITLPEAATAIQPDFSAETVAEFSGVSFESLTSFFAFELKAKKGQANAFCAIYCATVARCCSSCCTSSAMKHKPQHRHPPCPCPATERRPSRCLALPLSSSSWSAPWNGTHQDSTKCTAF